MGGYNLKDEFKLTDEQLNLEIEETDLSGLAACFDNVDGYVEKLGLTTGQQTVTFQRQFQTNDVHTLKKYN